MQKALKMCNKVINKNALRSQITRMCNDENINLNYQRMFKISILTKILITRCVLHITFASSQQLKMDHKFRGNFDAFQFSYFLQEMSSTSYYFAHFAKFNLKHKNQMFIYKFFFKDDRMEMCVTMKTLKTTCYIPINKLSSFAHEGFNFAIHCQKQL